MVRHEDTQANDAPLFPPLEDKRATSTVPNREVFDADYFLCAGRQGFGPRAFSRVPPRNRPTHECDSVNSRVPPWVRPRDDNPRHKPVLAEQIETRNPRAELQELRYMTTKPGEARTTFDASQTFGAPPDVESVVVCHKHGTVGSGKSLQDVVTFRMLRIGSMCIQDTKQMNTRYARFVLRHVRREVKGG